MASIIYLFSDSFSHCHRRFRLGQHLFELFILLLSRCLFLIYCSLKGRFTTGNSNGNWLVQCIHAIFLTCLRQINFSEDKKDQILLTMLWESVIQLLAFHPNLILIFFYFAKKYMYDVWLVRRSPSSDLPDNEDFSTSGLVHK